MSCITTRQPHRLMTVATISDSAPGVSHPVRWCQDCGAIVIDTDVDGRTMPGDVWAMTIPTLARRSATSGRAS